MQRSGHLRLIAFFVLLGVLGGAAGVLLLEAAGASRSASAILLAAVGFVTFVGFTGVFWHRLTVAKARWRETEQYLTRLRRASDRYRALLEGAADMLLVVEPVTGRVRECNLRARETLEGGAELPGPRLADAQALGAPGTVGAGDERAAPAAPRASLSALVDPSDAERLLQSLAGVVQADGTAGSPGLTGLHLRGAGGRTIVADARFAVIDLGDERVVQIALRDVTREKEMERQLAVHERLSAIGLLTAGVAHEINNPLEGIGNYLGLLERSDLPEADKKRYLEAVHHGFRRVGDIVRDLLRFARPTSGEGTADLALVVEDALKLVRYTERFHGIEVARTGLDRPLPVVGDPGRLEQIVFNLLLNAAQAMDGRGRVRISARATGEAAGNARMLELAVEDSGPGIPQEHLDRLFDPFFTTRGGTGLGLSVSYGIARAHGGTLAAENGREGGARFVLRLPWPRAREPKA